MRAVGPVVLWLVLFSIVVHGLFIPILVMIYKWRGVQPITEDTVHMRRLSIHVAPPANAVESGGSKFLEFNRFSRLTDHEHRLPTTNSDHDLLTESGPNDQHSTSAVALDQR